MIRIKLKQYLGSIVTIAAVLFLFVYRGLKVKEHKKKTVLRLFPNLS